MSFRVQGGSFGNGGGILSSKVFVLPKKTGWGSEQVAVAQVASAELASEERVKKVVGTLGWGAAGGLVLGPVGLLAGLLLGGKKTEVAFIVTFIDGRSFLGVGDLSTWVSIKGATLEPIALNDRKAVRRLASEEATTKESIPTEPPPPISKPIEFVEWAFRTGGWEFDQKRKVGYERYAIFEATRGRRAVVIVAAADPVTNHSLHLMMRSLDGCGPGERIIVAPSFSRHEERTAQAAAITLCEPNDLNLAIVRA